MHRSDTQDGNKPGKTMGEVLVSQKETWDVLKGKENPLRNLGKLTSVRGKDYNAGDAEGTITSQTDRQTSEGSGVTSGTGTGCWAEIQGKSDKDTPRCLPGPLFSGSPTYLV